MMMRIAALIAGVLLARVVLAIDTEPPLPDPVQQERYESLIHELRCLQCRSQSLADSDVSLAADLRREVRRLIAAGRSDADVKAFLTARYGDYVLFRPPLNQRTWLLWFAPALLLGGGALIAWRVVRKRGALAIDDGNDGGDTRS